MSHTNKMTLQFKTSSLLVDSFCPVMHKINLASSNVHHFQLVNILQIHWQVNLLSVVLPPTVPIVKISVCPCSFSLHLLNLIPLHANNSTGFNRTGRETEQKGRIGQLLAGFTLDFVQMCSSVVPMTLFSPLIYSRSSARVTFKSLSLFLVCLCKTMFLYSNVCSRLSCPRFVSKHQTCEWLRKKSDRRYISVCQTLIKIYVRLRLEHV